MWLKRGVCTRSESGVPSRLPINPTGGAHVGDHRGRSPQGEPHSGGHLAAMNARWPRSRCGPRVSRRPSCWPGPSRSRSAPGPSSPPVVSVTCWPSSSSMPASTSLDVPPTLASRVRVLGTGRSEKNDPNDAFSVAVAALRSDGLRRVEPADHTEIMRLLGQAQSRSGPDAGPADLPAPQRPGRPLTRRNCQGTLRF